MYVNDCYHCGGAVRSRKPSTSGASFCRKPECQNAKQRFFRKRWKDSLTVERDGDVSRAYMSAAVHEPRQPCPTCGLEDAVPPYIHRDARNPKTGCDGVGGVGPAIGLPTFWVDVIHPDLAARGMAQ